MTETRYYCACGKHFPSKMARGAHIGQLKSWAEGGDPRDEVAAKHYNVDGPVPPVVDVPMTYDEWQARKGFAAEHVLGEHPEVLGSPEEES